METVSAPSLVKGSSYRTAVGLVADRARSYIWIILLPAAAECTASVWFPALALGKLDLQLAALNITGALIEGFFAAWEQGAAVARGPIGDACSWLADDMRGSFLSTYTSWAGMVGFAAALAHTEQSLSAGFAYMLLCVLCAFVAHAIGRFLAMALFPKTNDKKGSASNALRVAKAGNWGDSMGHHMLIGALLAYIGGTYVLVAADVSDFSDADATDSRELSQLPALFSFLDAGENRLLVAMVCSIAGAATGNALGNWVDNSLVPGGVVLGSVPAGTLVCNTVFALLGVSLNAATLRGGVLPKWHRSVLLQSFAGSFCGAASAFAGHASDARYLYRTNGASTALKNSLVNLALSTVIFFLALEIERMLSAVGTVDADSNGVVELYEVGAWYGVVEQVVVPCKGWGCKKR